MRQNAINETKQEKGSTMKHIITTTVLAATLIAASPSIAVEAPRDGGFNQKANGTLKDAVNQMVVSIEKSLGVFEGLNRSQREKMSEFDNIITQIEYSVSVTAANGALNKKIAGAISLAHQQAEWCTTTANAKQNDRLADRYRQLAKVAQDKAAAIQKNAEMVLSVNGELAEMLPSIQEEKGLYYAAAVIGDLETANKSLVDVHRNMKKVVGLLSQLNRLDEQFNVPAPVFALR
tara:strand:+ start:152 stop:853 length:702 start_codon:yes stop_codon:yes gene_type:complete